MDDLYQAKAAADRAHVEAEVALAKLVDEKIAERGADGVMVLPEVIEACSLVEQRFAAFIAARDAWEAAQPYDPLDDFNYVGSHHHY